MTRAEFNRSIVSATRGWIGTPYHHQQSTKRQGADCLGLVRGVWREICGLEQEPVPNYGSSWKTGGDDLLIAALRRQMEPVCGIGFGRVLAFRYKQGLPVHHVAISTSGSTMIHAYHGRGVVEVDVTSWWMRRMVECFEFPLTGALI